MCQLPALELSVLVNIKVNKFSFIEMTKMHQNPNQSNSLAISVLKRKLRKNLRKI